VTEGTTALLAVVSIGAVAALLVAAAWHIWYAMGLARVFAQHDTDPWRAWVPFMNEAEVLRLGRVDPVKVALFLVPVVNLYALVLKGIAARRLDAAAGRGVGSTVLAVLLPPVWAMLAAQTRTAPPAAAVAPPEAAPTPGVAFPAPPLPVAAAASAPLAVGGVIGAPPAVGAPPAAIAPAAAIAPPAALAPAAPMPGTGAPVFGAGSPVPAPAVPVPPAAPATAAPVAGPARPESQVEEPAPLTRRARRGGDDATAIVRPPAGWELLLPSGEATAVVARSIVLGRNPNPTEPGVQYVAVSDEGRTVSKHHARLEWDGERWTITDLGSTNGVAVVDAAGDEQILAAEGTASVIERVVLGDAVVVVRRAAA
jgi:hypothetical protein